MRWLFGRDDALAVVKGDGEAIHDGTTQDDLGTKAGDPCLDERLEALDSHGAAEFRSLDRGPICQGPAADEIRRAKGYSRLSITSRSPTAQCPLPNPSKSEVPAAKLGESLIEDRDIVRTYQELSGPPDGDILPPVSGLQACPKLIVQAIVLCRPFSKLLLECSIHSQPSRQRLYQYLRKNVKRILSAHNGSAYVRECTSTSNGRPQPSQLHSSPARLPKRGESGHWEERVSLMRGLRDHA